MPEDNKTQEFLQKLAPCIERGELEASVEEAAQLAKDMGTGSDLLGLSALMIKNEKYDFALVFALAATLKLGDEDKADAYFNAALAAGKLGLKRKEEEYYKKVVEINPDDQMAHYNYAILLWKQGNKTDAIGQCEKAIDANPEFMMAYLLCARLSHKLNKKCEAEKYYRKAIELDPKNFKPHVAYSSFLIELDRRKDAVEEIEIASNILDSEQTKISNLAKALFYQRYSEKNVIKKKFQESSKDVYNAGLEYLKFSETAEGESKYAFELKGNVCKAQSFIRKEHKTNQELVNDLKNASEFYKKASVCPAGGTEETCNACYSVMEVFSQALTVLEEVAHNKKPSIRKDEWNANLEKSNEIYLKKGSEKGVALVAALKELIKCVDELAYYTARKSSLQKKRLKECYKTLEDVSSKVEGGLRNITDPANEIIKTYSKKIGIPMPEEKDLVKPHSLLDNRLIKIIIGAIGAIVLGIIANRLFALDLDLKIWNYIKSFFP